MAKVIKFPLKSTGRFDLKPVRRRRRKKTEDPGQLDLFEQGKGRVVSIDKDSGTFGVALEAHDNDISKAEQLYKKSIESGEHVADAYCNLGILESQGGKTAIAIDSFTNALEKDPRHYEAHYNLANIYADSGNLKLAKLHYEIAREINSEDANLHYNLAIVLASLELFDEALAALESYFSFTGEYPIMKLRNS